ncbi:ABC transporter ATP-binding protein [Parafrankia sp. EUN1f]|uniref:ABC transporter ATP-binding protein n=1 Tax=Parafrankia sp. EUN1f TaxID=102897 RepID=UPI0001C46FCD|nr:ATP-binding cassette domain-containing protein [Parafrankia sp. EUN1f]EFC86768.1 ABC transporter related protein [Parafrankia sp. EUN1f]
MAGVAEGTSAVHGADEPVIATQDLQVGFNRRAFVREVNLDVRSGEKVALLGANGAGKTTTLMALAGLVAPLGGTVMWLGRATSGLLHQRSKHGLGFVPAERSIFSRMTVADNIRVGRCAVDDVLRHFPELEKRLTVSAGSMSGGEQQMLSLGRALARKPRLLIIDELSLGLAPVVIDRLYRAINEAAREGTGVLFVEQHVEKALSLADRAYVLARGRIVMAGTAAAVSARSTEIEEVYLGGRTQVDEASEAHG